MLDVQLVTIFNLVTIIQILEKVTLKCNYSGHFVNILTIDLLKVVFD